MYSLPNPVWINYAYRVVYVRFIGTHAQYDQTSQQPARSLCAGAGNSTGAARRDQVPPISPGSCWLEVRTKGVGLPCRASPAGHRR